MIPCTSDSPPSRPPALPCLRERAGRHHALRQCAGQRRRPGLRSTAKCGDPDHRDDVGYTLGSYDRREFKVEEWVYGPRNGVTYILTFEANKLKRIEFKR